MVACRQLFLHSRLYLIILSVFGSCSYSLAQPLPEASRNDSTVGIMFYNVENLFDVQDDPMKDDEEFLPGGPRGWSYYRMKQKMTNISRVVLNAGAWDLPVIVGLCEVENRWVLNTLIWETGLNNLGYYPVHFDSPDERGIDVAMLYRRSRFKVVSEEPKAVNLGPNERPTRDVLYVKGIVDKRDTLHVLVTHWPSRLGGVMASQWKRKVAARVIKRVTDSIHTTNPHALMLVMGDFNEEPQSGLFAEEIGIGKSDGILVNTASALKPGSGTLKYQHDWSVFDQVLVSHTLLAPDASLHLAQPMQRIVKLSFLIVPDPVFGGSKPFRTYTGFKYTGGFSDHLPVWIELQSEKQNR